MKEKTELEYLLESVKEAAWHKQPINAEILIACIESAISTAEIEKQIKEMKP